MFHVIIQEEGKLFNSNWFQDTPFGPTLSLQIVIHLRDGKLTTLKSLKYSDELQRQSLNIFHSINIKEGRTKRFY